MNEIIEMLINLKIDKPMYITDDIIKQYIEAEVSHALPAPHAHSLPLTGLPHHGSAPVTVSVPAPRHSSSEAHS